MNCSAREDVNYYRRGVILKGLIQILFCLLYFVSFSARAEAPKRDVVLLLWFEDFEAFSAKRFKEAVQARQKELSVPLRAVMIPMYFDQETAFEKIDESLQPGDRITGLFIATHGLYSYLLNQTFLKSFGGFSRFGVHGLLKKIIKRYAGWWGENLTIFLDSCSTFAGFERSLMVRTKKLARAFEKVGVRKLWVWGAHHTLRIDGPGKYNNTDLEIPDDESQIMFLTVFGNLTTAIATISMTEHLGWTALATFVSFWTFAGLHSYILDWRSKPYQTDGSFVSVYGRNWRTVPVDANDPRFKDLTECAELLAEDPALLTVPSASTVLGNTQYSP